MKLRNQEIWLAYTNLEKIAQLKLPVKTSFEVAVLMSKLRQPYLVVENERKKLVFKHGTYDPETKQAHVAMESESAGDFAREYGELLTEKWPEDIIFKKVKLPEKVVNTCEECGHKIEVEILIESNTLLPLTGKFVE